MVDENSKDTEGGFDAAQAAAEFAAEFAAAMADEPAASDTSNYTAVLEDEVEALGRVLADKDKALQVAQENAAAASAEVDRVRARNQTRCHRTPWVPRLCRC